MAPSAVDSPPAVNGHGGLSLPQSPQYARTSSASYSYANGDSMSHGSTIRTTHGRRISRKGFSSGGGYSRITETVNALKRRSANELGAAVSGRVSNASYGSLIEWIRTERLSRLPPEGSPWDKVLAWAQLLAERLHGFDSAIESFASDSYKAAQLAYGYIALLLELGHENASALVVSFGFFYNCSLALNALLDRAELFSVSSEIREQLALAYADLVTLVVDVGTHYHRAIRGISTTHVSVDIYRTFAGPIESFRHRRERIADEMWKYQMVQENLVLDDVVDIKTIREWLSPSDRVLATLASDHAYLAQDREELTCLWFYPYLNRFMKDTRKSLAITGKPGSGKTVLAGTIVDRLHRSKKAYTTIFVPINGRIPTEANSLSVVRTLLRQLFEQRIGNLQLYTGLVEAYHLSRRTADSKLYEQQLWQTFSSVLGKTVAGANDVVIIVDGLDELSGDGSDQQTVFKQLQEATSKQSNVKLITLSQPEAVPTTERSRLDITPETVYDDIVAVVRKTFSRHTAYTSRSFNDQELVAHSITQASNGSFLWAKLTSKAVMHEDTPAAMTKALENLQKQPMSLTETIFMHLTFANLTDEGKLILTWLATAERPLSLHELTTLCSVDVTKGTLSEKPVDIFHLLKPINSLIFIQDGLAYLRHGLIRQSLIEIFSSGKYALPVKDHRHVDVVKRLLIYIKNVINDQPEPSFVSPDLSSVYVTFNSHPLLEYAIRYWITHVSQTSLYKPKGAMPLPKEFKAIFPSSTKVALLEKTCWDSKPTPMTLTWHDAVTRIRRECFTDNHPATLQSTITLALYFLQINNVPEASTWFFKSTEISKHVLPTQHTLTTQLATQFLEITTSMITTSRTEIMTRRESILQILIECYTVQFGATSELVISTRTQLMELYMHIKEEQKATALKESIYGKTETTETTGATTETTHTHGDLDRNLSIRLHGHVDAEEAEVATWSLFGQEERDTVISKEHRSAETILREAEALAAKGEHLRAEQLFIEAWQRSIHNDNLKIQAVLAYSKYLQSQKREHESSALLQGLWQEYEHSSSSRSESVVSKLVEVAKAMKTVGLVAASLSVFQHCASYFESTNQRSHSAYSEAQQQVQSTSRSLMQSASSSSESSSTVSESVLYEMVFGSSSSSKTTTVDASTVSAVRILTATLITQHRWQDATKAIKRVLRSIWPTFFSPSIEDVTLPQSNVDEAIELAERLASCYYNRRRSEKYEDTSIRLYRAVLSSRKPDDKLVEQTSRPLLNLYDIQDRRDKTITVYQLLLSAFRKQQIPEDHAPLIKLLFTLADLTSPSPVSIDYYLQIVTALNKKTPDVCHPDAIEPLIIVSNHNWIERRYAECVQLYRVLFNTFKQKPKEYKTFHDTKTVETIFQRYVSSLRETRADISLIYSVTKEYRSVVTTTFGATSAIAVKATLVLARVCQESKRYESEAITLYEELVKSNTTHVDLGMIRATLDAIHEEQAIIATRSATESTASSQQVDQAFGVMRKRVTQTRSKYGWAHEESLSQLKEMSSLYARQSKSETAVQELTEATRQIVTQEKSSTKLVQSAAAIAASYHACGQTTRGIELAEDLHRQIVTKDTRSVAKHNIDLTKTDTRQTAVFLAQLEYSLRQDATLTFGEIYSSIMTELVYYEQYRAAITKKSSIETVFASAAHLHTFVSQRKNRAWLKIQIEDDLVSYFISTEGPKAKIDASSTAGVKVLVLSLLEHFEKYSVSTNFSRTINIVVLSRVRSLIHHRQHREAAELALVGFKYIHYLGGYSSQQGVQQGFRLAMLVSCREGASTPRATDAALANNMTQIAGTIVKEMLRVAKSFKIDIARAAPLNELNLLIGLLGEVHDFAALEDLIGVLWTSQRTSRDPSTTFSLGEKLVLARYANGNHAAAVRLCENIVYNLRRVHGARAAAVLDMSTLLAELYTGLGVEALRQGDKGQLLAKSWFKKAAGVHEEVLRSLTEEASGYDGEDGLFDEDDGIDGSVLVDGRGAYGVNGHVNAGLQQQNVDLGAYARKHLGLLKIACQRYGGWPKEYAELESINADTYRLFPDALKGVEGVEKWNVKTGVGKAEGAQNLGVVDFNSIKDWEFLGSRPALLTQEVEEEL